MPASSGQKQIGTNYSTWIVIPASQPDGAVLRLLRTATLKFAVLPIRNVLLPSNFRLRGSFTFVLFYTSMCKQGRQNYKENTNGRKIIIMLLCIATSSYNQTRSCILVQLGRPDYLGSNGLLTTRIGLAWPSFMF